MTEKGLYVAYTVAGDVTPWRRSRAVRSELESALVL
jgi:hypothetical protein